MATEVRLSLTATFAENRAALEAFAAAAELAGDRRWWKAANVLEVRAGRRAIDDTQLIAAALELRTRAPGLSKSRVCWLIAEGHAEARGMTGAHARAYAAATVASVARRLGGKIDEKVGGNRFLAPRSTVACNRNWKDATMTVSTATRERPSRQGRPSVSALAAPPAKVTYVVLTWAGGRSRFHLGSNAWGRLEGPDDRIRAVLGRLIAGTWGVADVVNTIRAGLDGPEDESDLDPVRLRRLIKAGELGFGGETETGRLIRQYVHGRPLGESVALAQAILVAALYGLPPALAEAGMAAEDLTDAVLKAHPSAPSEA